MCDYEEFLFDCGCSEQRLKSYCHFARNDPHHQCFGVKKLRDVWEQRRLCDACTLKHYQGQQRQAKRQQQTGGFSGGYNSVSQQSGVGGSSSSSSGKSGRGRR